MKKLTRRQRQQVYRQAADNILTEENFYGCCAIECAAYSVCGAFFRSDQTRDLLDEYALFFKPEYAPASYPWWDSTDVKSQEERALALLFMAEIT